MVQFSFHKKIFKVFFANKYKHNMISQAHSQTLTVISNSKCMSGGKWPRFALTRVQWLGIRIRVTSLPLHVSNLPLDATRSSLTATRCQKLATRLQHFTQHCRKCINSSMTLSQSARFRLFNRKPCRCYIVVFQS